MIPGIEWHDNGYFRCSNTNICVKGIAGDLHALAELARRAGVLRTSRRIYEASDGFADIGHDPEAWLLARYSFHSDFQRKRADKAALSELKLAADSLPADRKAMVQLAKARADELNAAAPLVPSPRIFDSHTEGLQVSQNRALRGFAAWVDWISPEKIVTTNARAWNDIDRTPPRRSVIDVAAALATSTDLHRWVELMSPDHDSVHVSQIEGPAGPIYEVDTGTHRAHAARLFSFPRLLALVRPAGLPVAVRPTDPETSAVWSGLIERGLLQAKVSDHQWWYVRAVVADWMLAPPSEATQINTAYERLYPGALTEATGLSVDELTHPKLWKRALIGRRRWR
jgi:hypothetical protein